MSKDGIKKIYKYITVKIIRTKSDIKIKCEWMKLKRKLTQ
jgi:hypothetical protein